MRAEKKGCFTSKVNARGGAGDSSLALLAVVPPGAFGANVAMAQSITGGLYGNGPTDVASPCSFTRGVS